MAHHLLLHQLVLAKARGTGALQALHFLRLVRQLAVVLRLRAAIDQTDRSRSGPVERV